MADNGSGSSSRLHRSSSPSSPYDHSFSPIHPQPTRNGDARVSISSFDHPYADSPSKTSIDLEHHRDREDADSINSDDAEILLHRPGPIAGHEDEDESDLRSMEQRPPAYSGLGQERISSTAGRGDESGRGEGHDTRSIRSTGTLSLEERKMIWWKNTFITGLFILSWYCFATILSLYNKWMFSADHYGFGFPLFVTFCHMIVQSICAAVLRKAMPKRFRPPERPTRQDYISKIFPTAAATAGDVGLSNVSLKIITLSLYTMCKSSALIFVLFFAFFLRLEAFSIRLLAVILLISFGVFCMVYTTTTVNIAGVFLVFTASFLSGARWGLTEVLMKKRAIGMTNPFATIFWLAPLMALTLGVVSLAVEGWGHVFTSGFFHGPQAILTILVIILPGLIAFSMVTSEFFIIQRAGIVPMSIAGIFKEVSTISISAWVFGDQLTELNIVGVVITVSGIALYSYHKYQKSVHSTDPLDKHGRPVKGGEAGSTPFVLDDERHAYAAVGSLASNEQAGERSPLAPNSAGSGGSRHTMHTLHGEENGEDGDHEYPPVESPDKRSLDPALLAGDAIRREAEEEGGDEEVQRHIHAGAGPPKRWFERSWGPWWDKSM